MNCQFLSGAYVAGIPTLDIEGARKGRSPKGITRPQRRAPSAPGLRAAVGLPEARLKVAHPGGEAVKAANRKGGQATKKIEALAGAARFPTDAREKDRTD